MRTVFGGCCWATACKGAPSSATMTARAPRSIPGRKLTASTTLAVRTSVLWRYHANRTLVGAELEVPKVPRHEGTVKHMTTPKELAHRTPVRKAMFIPPSDTPPPPSAAGFLSRRARSHTKMDRETRPVLTLLLRRNPCLLYLD